MFRNKILKVDIFQEMIFNILTAAEVSFIHGIGILSLSPILHANWNWVCIAPQNSSSNVVDAEG